jgi:hypothetical protein
MFVELNMKKASANMWWIIIGAVIALVVLVVLLVIFTDKTGDLEKGLSSCDGKGGVCVSEETCPIGTLSASAFECSDGKCCIGSPKRGSECDGPNEEARGSPSYCYSK